MKKLERTFKWISALVIGLVGGLIIYGGYTATKTIFSQDFLPTPGVTYTNLMAETKNQRVVLVLYREGCPYCQALKPAMHDVIEGEGTTGQMPKTVYVSVKSDEGRKIAEKFGIKTVPNIILLNQSGQMVMNASWKNKTYSFPAPAVTEKVKGEHVSKPSQIKILKDYIRAAELGTW